MEVPTILEKKEKIRKEEKRKEKKEKRREEKRKEKKRTEEHCLRGIKDKQMYK